ncbi:unnamed protein product [marine sediment metagenome]|uniref:Uncharacterized protein n=1 Tax=marine sediment metagenome TaxID=412755 RepID=X1PUN9_9ZZZZ
MPSAAQLRNDRIDKLVAEFEGTKTRTLAPIYKRSLELFPRVTKERTKTYAEAALRILKANRKAAKKEAKKPEKEES